MPIRDFTDTEGTRWVVWSTVPSPGSVIGSMRDGWLTFASGQFRRRLIPIPDRWESASVARLEALRDEAVAVRRTPPRGIAVDDTDSPGP